MDRYFSTRLIGAPEVVTTLLSYQIAGGTQRIISLDTSKVPKSRQSRVLTDRSGRSIAPRDKEVIPRWRILTPLSGEEYYYHLLLLSVPFRNEKDLISDNNVSKSYREECFLRDLVKQGEDSLNALEDAAQRNFSVDYIHKIAKMLILHQPEVQESVNNKLRDVGLGEVVANVTKDASKEVCIDLLLEVGRVHTTASSERHRGTHQEVDYTHSFAADCLQTDE